QRYLSAIGLDGAGENLQQSRFAGAVGPNQPDAVPFGNGEGDTPKERCGPVGFRDILCVENRRHIVWLSLGGTVRSEEHTSELQSLTNLVCRLLLEKKK